VSPSDRPAWLSASARRRIQRLRLRGGMSYLLADAVRGAARGLVSRKMWAASFAQMVRVGVKSLGIVCWCRCSSALS